MKHVKTIIFQHDGKSLFVLMFLGLIVWPSSCAELSSSQENLAVTQLLGQRVIHKLPNMSMAESLV